MIFSGAGMSDKDGDAGLRPLRFASGPMLNRESIRPANERGASNSPPRFHVESKRTLFRKNRFSIFADGPGKAGSRRQNAPTVETERHAANRNGSNRTR